jgi:hypothetical protein
MSNTINIYKTFIVDTPQSTSGDPIDNLYVKDIHVTQINPLSGDTIQINGDLIPSEDDQFIIGTNIRRFREINTVSGYSTFWSGQTMVIDTVSGDTIHLGYDPIAMEERILNKYTSILIDDDLLGGNY